MSGSERDARGLERDALTPLLAFVGPTASGKTDLAIEVALRLRPVARLAGERTAGPPWAEIVSADSMQVYRGMDIGTGKATPAQQAQVPHHLLDVVEFDHPFTVAEYAERADRAVSGGVARGRLPILVGGTGLYVRAVVDGLDFAPPGSDPALRAELAERARVEGPASLHGELRDVDPAAAARIHPHDIRRVARALEVFRLTGEPISARGRRPPRYDVMLFGLSLPRQELYQRIEARVDRQLQAGWLEETERLMRQGFGRSSTAVQALGYTELAAHLRGEIDLPEARRRIVTATRRFAKRQLTWFRADPRIRWVEAGEARSPVEAVATIVAAVEGKWGVG